MADMIPLSNDVTPVSGLDNNFKVVVKPVRRPSSVHGKGDIRLGSLYTSTYKEVENLGPVTVIKGKIIKPGLTIIMGMAPAKWENLSDKNQFINLLLEKIINQSYQ